MKKSIISRTIINNMAHGIVYNEDKKAVEEFTAFLPAAVNTTERAEKFIRKNNLPIGGKLVSVDSLEKSELLIGMYLDTFVANAVKVSERSKETRNTITKTVIANECVCLYMTDNREVKETTVIVPSGCTNFDGYVRKNCKFDGKFIEVSEVHEISELYSMDENKFIELAKPMKNKFQLAE